MKDQILQRIASRKAVVGVVGLGYVGLPLSLQFAESGFPTLGFDIDPIKAETLNRGETYIKHITGERVASAVAGDMLAATSDFSRAKECDALILCVPTPLGAHMEPDMQYVVGSLDSLREGIRAGQILSLESTTYPGTTREIVVPQVEQLGFEVGKEVFVAFSPEREDPGNPSFRTATIPKVVGGVTDACREVGVALYGSVIERIVPVSSPEVAEMSKLLENIYRAVNVGLVNELKIVCDAMEIDIWEVIEAASTKPFGFTPFYPGPGLGGHCIPIDPYYLAWRAREFGVRTRFIELAGDVNRRMPDYVVSRLAEALNEQGKALRGANILVLGLAYKKNVDDLRESPAVEILSMLLNKGANARYSDPYFPSIPKMRRHDLQLHSVEVSAEALADQDAVLIATDHDSFDYDLVLRHARMVVDSRGRLRGEYPHVRRA